MSWAKEGRVIRRVSWAKEGRVIRRVSWAKEGRVIRRVSWSKDDRVTRRISRAKVIRKADHGLLKQITFGELSQGKWYHGRPRERYTKTTREQSVLEDVRTSGVVSVPYIYSHSR